MSAHSDDERGLIVACARSSQPDWLLDERLNALPRQDGWKMAWQAGEGGRLRSVRDGKSHFKICLMIRLVHR